MAFLDEIGARLAAQGVGSMGTSAGLPNSIYISSKAAIPPSAGPFLTLIETGGSGSAKTQNDTATERPTMQITARGANYPAMRLLLAAAYAALGGANGLYNVTLNGAFYLSVAARQSIATDVGMDDIGRAMAVLNFDVEKQAEASTPGTGISIVGGTMQTILNGAVYSLGTTMLGILTVNIVEDNRSLMYEVLGSLHTTIIDWADPAIGDATQDVPGTMNCYWSAANGRYELQNLRGGTRTVRLSIAGSL